MTTGFGDITNSTIATNPNCSWMDSLWMSQGCQQALQAANYGTEATGGNALVLSPPPGAGSLSTSDLTSAQTDPSAALTGEWTSAAAALLGWQQSVANTNIPGSTSSDWIPWAVGAAILLIVVKVI